VPKGDQTTVTARAHLEKNVAAVDIALSDAEFDALDREGRAE
jgi:aryl-alcohol dehydrogenase-like predicted oxidoreductase